LESHTLGGVVLKKTGLVLSLLLCCAFVLWTTGCDDFMGTVTGTVTYKDGSPAAELKVGAPNWSENTAFGLRTDSEGRYMLENVPPGGLEVIVFVSESVKVTSWVTVESNQEAVLDIELP
jgi:hypothetical protein